VTVARKEQGHRAVIDAFREGGGEGKPVHLKAEIAYGRSTAAAMRSAWEQWRTNVFDGDVLAELRSPAQFEAAAAFVTEQDVAENVRLALDPEQHVEWLQGDAALGVDLVTLHAVGGDQQGFIDAFAADVLPAVRG
jgi:coenzyme F420-dependent glucose-6-phosphate dehydrogenase